MVKHTCPECGHKFEPAAKKEESKAGGAFVRAYRSSRKLWKKLETYKRNEALFKAGLPEPSWYRIPSHAPEYVPCAK